MTDHEFRQIPDDQAAVALAEVDPEGRELDWWGWAYMVQRLQDRGYWIVIGTEPPGSDLGYDPLDDI